jgi:hypothetical protein
MTARDVAQGQTPKRKRGSIELARSLCDDIAGEIPDGEQYGSVDVAEILSAEVERLRDLYAGCSAAYAKCADERDALRAEVADLRRPIDDREIFDLSQWIGTCSFGGSYDKCSRIATLLETLSRQLREALPYRQAWEEWRSLQSGDVQKMCDAARRCESAERRLSQCAPSEEAIMAARSKLQEFINLERSVMDGAFGLGAKEEVISANELLRIAKAAKGE